MSIHTGLTSRLHVTDERFKFNAFNNLMKELNSIDKQQQMIMKVVNKSTKLISERSVNKQCKQCLLNTMIWR